MNEFTQAAWQYEEMTQKERDAFLDNVTESLLFIEEDVQKAILKHFACVDESLEKFLRKRLRF